MRVRNGRPIGAGAVRDMNEYLELWADCAEWIDGPDAGARLATLLTEIGNIDGNKGLYFFCSAAVLCGVPEELIGRNEGTLYRLEVPEPDWLGHENLMQ